MARTSSSASPSNTMGTEIALKDPRLAAFLAWLIPGLGHLYQGRTGKAVLFFACILGTFVYGLYIGEGRVVYASSTQVLMWRFPFITPEFAKRWQYAPQLGVGLAALPAYVQTWRVESHKDPLLGGFMRPPYDIPPPDQAGGFQSKDQTDPNHVVEHPDELAKWNYDQGEYFDIGTVFTVIAGLLNILAIFDAYGGPLVLAPPDDKKKDA